MGVAACSDPHCAKKRGLSRVRIAQSRVIAHVISVEAAIVAMVAVGGVVATCEHTCMVRRRIIYLICFVMLR